MESYRCQFLIVNRSFMRHKLLQYNKRIALNKHSVMTKTERKSIRQFQHIISSVIMYYFSYIQQFIKNLRSEILLS